MDIIVYKSVLSMFTQALSCGFVCDRKTNPKEIGQCRYFGDFEPTKKKKSL